LTTVLLTGATGFLGSHLIRFLDSRGYAVRCLARKTSNLGQLPTITKEIFYGDVTQRETLPKALHAADVVVHLAAIRGEKPIPMNEYWSVNVSGTANLLEACHAEGVRRFIYCSTVGVMGWIKDPPADERHAINPIGAYHVTKARAEELVREYTSRGSIEGTVVRPVITYGAGDRDGMIFKLTRMLRNKRFVWIGDGANRLHLVAIENLMQGFETMIENRGSVGETFIIADATPITMDQVVRTICDALEVDPPVWRVPASLVRKVAVMAAKLASAKPGGREPMFTSMQVDILTRDRCYDISKARSVGYSPHVPTTTGLRRAVEWMRSQQLI
jgi:nucleoside-diphosphate-sugar epimerase